MYLDIVESVNLMMSAEGTVLRSNVQGAIYMRTHLSGMPNLSVGLNDRLGEQARWRIEARRRRRARRGIAGSSNWMIYSFISACVCTSLARKR